MCGMGRGIKMAEQQGAISKKSTQDEKTYEALRIQSQSKAPSLKEISKKQTKKTTKNKTSKSAVGSNPLNKSSTGLEIRRV